MPPDVPRHAESAPCAVCGRLGPKDEMLAFGTDWVSAECREVYLLRLQHGHETGVTPSPPAPQPAEWGARLLAWLADECATTITSAASIPVAKAFGATEVSAFACAGIVVTVVRVAHETLMTAHFGGTVGKLLFSLRVVATTGRPPSLGQAALRAVLKAPPFVPIRFILAWIGCSTLAALCNRPWRHAIHDRVCRTTVVDKYVRKRSRP